MKADGLTLEWTLPVSRRGEYTGSKPGAITFGKVPKITRLIALAIKFQGMVERGEISDYADIARLGYVTRARITQLMNLLNLAPDIQEEILFLPKTLSGRDLVTERRIRKITAVVAWKRQRQMWQSVVKSTEHLG